MTKLNRDSACFRSLRGWLILLWFLSSSTTADEPIVTSVTNIITQADSAFWWSGGLMFTTRSPGTVTRFSPDLLNAPCTDIKDHSVYFIVAIDEPEFQFVISLGTSLNTFTWKLIQEDDLTDTVNIKFDLIKDELLVCGIADSKGRLWVGSDKGQVYSVEADGSVTEKLTNVAPAQAIAFSPFYSTFYYVDAGNSKLMKHAYQLDSGNIETSAVVAFDFKANGLNNAAGLAIDNEGNAWIGCQDMFMVVKIDLKNNSVVKTISIDEEYGKPVSLAFGKYMTHYLDELYVTTTVGLIHIYASGSNGSTIQSFKFRP